MVFDKYALKNNLQDNMQINFSSWPLRISILPRVSYDNVQVIFFFVHVIVTYE